MELCVNTLVRNEDRYLWYAIRSVIDHVDKVLLWDTGSTDNTLKIIKELQDRYPKKIYFREMGEVNPDQFTAVRQKMLEASDCDWIIIVDGDEVWWKDRIQEIKTIVNSQGEKLDSIVSRYYNIVGDLYHYQNESAGKYNIDGKIGNYTIRAFNRNIKGLKFAKPHGQQGLYDKEGVLIQNRDISKRRWQKGYSYLHFTNMQRSGRRADDLKVPKRSFKLKYEIGESFPLDFYYPESFFAERPDNVESIWKQQQSIFKLKAMIQEPLRFLKRKIIHYEKSGY